MANFDASKQLYLVKLEVLSLLEQNIWTDLIYQLHPRINEVIVKSSTKGNFVCLACQKHRTSYTGASLKSFPKHLRVNYHLENMRKENMISINNDLQAIFDENQDECFNFKPPETINMENNGLISTTEPMEDINLKFNITQFILFHRLPFSISSDLAAFIKSLTENYTTKTLLECKLDRNKVTNITKKCISKSLKEDIVEELKASPFSLLVDGGSDSYGTSYLTVCAKFISRHNSKEPVTKLITVIEMGEESTGEAIYNDIRKSILNDARINKNFMALATDQGSNMAGPEIGLGKLLKDEFPQILPLYDLSHIYNLVCKHSIDIFPKRIVDMVKEVSSHFKRSNQRRVILKKYLEKNNIDPDLTVLTYTQTRWLSLTESLKRILRLWNALKEYFNDYNENNEKDFFSYENHLYASNLFIVLEQLTHYNKKFQTNQMRYDEVFMQLYESFSVFTQDILAEDFRGKNFKETLAMPWENEAIQAYIINTEEFIDAWTKVYAETNPLIAKLDKNIVNTIFETTKNFYVRILAQMKIRLPFTNKILEDSCVIYMNTEEYCKDAWQRLGEQFSNILADDEDKRIFQSDLKRMVCNYQGFC